MPTYEFRCPAGHEFERFFPRISDAPREVPCAECEAIAERQISGGAGLVFKGSGFYITDYGKDGKKDQRDRAKSSATDKPEKAAASGDASKSPASGGDSSGSGKASGSTSAAAPGKASNGGSSPGGGASPGGSSSGGSDR